MVRVSATQIYKFNVKFERKKVKAQYFFFLLRASARNETSLRGDEALLNLATGVTSSVMTEPNLKVTKYRTKRQAAKAACLKVRLFNKSVKVS